MNIDRFLKFSFWIFIFSLTIIACKSDSSPDKKVKYPSFFTSIHQPGIFEMTVAFNLDSLKYYKDEEIYQPATLIIEQHGTQKHKIEITARGVTRKLNCEFPPLRIKIPKKVAKANHWGPQRRYKLVTQCNASDSMGVIMLREYLVYQLYEIMNPYSLKTQLCRMIYQTPKDTFSNYAFLIEDDEEMGTRLGLQILDVDKNPPKSVHIENYRIFALFQYMIGNTDWNLSNGHNTLYLIQEETHTPIVVPYDFDQSGLVNAPYAKPYPTLPISHVRERLFQYRGKNTDDFSTAIGGFLGEKETILAKVSEFEQLPQADKVDILAYLQSFYDIIEQNNWKDHVFKQ